MRAGGKCIADRLFAVFAGLDGHGNFLSFGSLLEGLGNSDWANTYWRSKSTIDSRHTKSSRFAYLKSFGRHRIRKLLSASAIGFGVPTDAIQLSDGSKAECESEHY